MVYSTLYNFCYLPDLICSCLHLSHSPLATLAFFLFFVHVRFLDLFLLPRIFFLQIAVWFAPSTLLSLCLNMTAMRLSLIMLLKIALFSSWHFLFPSALFSSEVIVTFDSPYFASLHPTEMLGVLFLLYL